MEAELYDFSECHSRGEFPSPPVKLMRGWGDSPEGGGSWEGGFLLKLKNGQYAYVEGWCDYTGWG